MQAVQGQQGKQAAQREQQELAGQGRHQLVAGAFCIEQGAQLPVAAGQGDQFQALCLFCRSNRRDDAASLLQIIGTRYHAVTEQIFEQPVVLALVLLAQPAAQRTGAHAQYSVTVVRLTQQQVERAAVLCTEGEVIGRRAAALLLVANEAEVARLAGAVGQQLPVGIEPGHAVDGREDAAQCRDQFAAVASARRAALQHRLARLRLEAHVQTQVLGQLGAVTLAQLLLTIEQLAVFLSQLPGQQSQHRQHQHHQGTAQCCARLARGGGRQG